MPSLSDTNPFLETVNDGGGGGRVWASGGYGVVVHGLCQRVGTLGFGQGGNYLGAVLEGRTLGTVVEA